MRDVIPFRSEAERDQRHRIELSCGSEVLFLLKALQSSNGIGAPRPVRLHRRSTRARRALPESGDTARASGPAGAYGEPTRWNVAALPRLLWAADLECDEPRVDLDDVCLVEDECFEAVPELECFECAGDAFLVLGFAVLTVGGRRSDATPRGKQGP